MDYRKGLMKKASSYVIHIMKANSTMIKKI